MWFNTGVVEKLPFLTPAFFPDATRGVIRGLDSQDLTQAGVEGLVVNTFHLMTAPGKQTIKNHHGIKGLMHWPGTIVSDSGGFQIMSLIQESGKGSVTDKGMHVDKGSKRINLTPEKSIRFQFELGADVMVCLDAFTPEKASASEATQSVDRTLRWAKECKKTFDQLSQNQARQPLLVGVVQGGSFLTERKRCAQGLIDLGITNFGFGGWPIDSTGTIRQDELATVAESAPEGALLYALGVGNPTALVQTWRLGYQLFDCVLPTRDARHKRLYTFTQSITTLNLSSKFWNYLHIGDQRYFRDAAAISPVCDCSTCLNYSRAYLHHLFNIGDSLGSRLATIHNLRFYTQLIEILRQQ